MIAIDTSRISLPVVRDQQVQAHGAKALFDASAVAAIARCRLRSLLLTTLMIIVSPGWAAPAHEHGTARLDIALDGDQLEITLESPLENLVGFEHPPRNDRQRALLTAMESRLADAGALFAIDAAAGCKPVATTVHHPFLRGEQGAADGHGDADATWSFRCGSPTALRQIEVRLFSAFAGLKKLRVQTATPRGQSAVVLDAARRLVAF